MRFSSPVLPSLSIALALAVLVSAPAATSRAQENHGPLHSQFTFLPGRAPALPLVAADQEPRVGIRKEIGSSKLILDIGSTFDLVAYGPSDERDGTLRAGLDLFTYALSTSVSGRRLQIDAVDGFFGGHLLYHLANSNPALTLRLRIIHRSAHFIDGHYDNGLQQWRGGRAPIPFTRDFGDLLCAGGWNLGAIRLTVYSGLSYSTLVRPVEMRRLGTIHGLEFTSGDLLGELFGRPWSAFGAFNLSVDGIPTYVGTGTLVTGVKFGELTGQGIRVLVGYRTGLEPFGQYYDVRRNFWTLGLMLDVW